MKNNRPPLSSSPLPVDLSKTKRLSPYRFGAFLAMHAAVAGAFWIWAVMNFCFLLLWVTVQVDDFMLLLKISLSLFGLYSILVAVFYARFYGWKERLSFPVTGWDELLNESSTMSGSAYRIVTIRLVPIDTATPSQCSYLTAALKIHNGRQNGYFSKTKDFWENRTPWSLLSPLEASGAVNSYGIGRIMYQLRNEFSELAKRTSCLKEVNIRFEKRTFEHHPRPNV